MSNHFSKEGEVDSCGLPDRTSTGSTELRGAGPTFRTPKTKCFPAAMAAACGGGQGLQAEALGRSLWCSKSKMSQNFLAIYIFYLSIYVKQSRRVCVWVCVGVRGCGCGCGWVWVCACVEVCLSGYGRPNRRTDRHQTRSADATHHQLETDPATPYIWGRFEVDIEVDIEVQSSLC